MPFPIRQTTELSITKIEVSKDDQNILNEIVTTPITRAELLFRQKQAQRRKELGENMQTRGKREDEKADSELADIAAALALLPEEEVQSK